MKIAIDISPVIYGTGVSRYIKNLVENLLKYDKKNDYLLVGYSLRRSEELKKYTKTLNGRFEEKILKLPPVFFDVLWNRFHIIHFEKMFGKCDIYHSSDWTQAPSKAHKVTTVHDLVPILHPEYSLTKIISVYKRKLDLVRKEVDKIIVPSKQTKSDLVKIGFLPEKISIISEAVDQVFSRNIDKESNNFLLKELKITKPFLLAIGITPRKNVDNVLLAFKLFNKNKHYRLVIIGEPKIQIQKDENVIYTGFIQDQKLASLYQESSALIYPSLYEGFGLPIIEAMSCGTPVITSNYGSMAEIGQGSAVLVDPLNIINIANGIEDAINNRDLLVKNGFQKVKCYSWENTAKHTIDLYNSLKQ